MSKVLLSLTVSLILTAASAAEPVNQTPLTSSTARMVFDEAKAISDADAGELWGVALYGPIVLVEADSRKAVANQPVLGFGNEDGVFVGVLPEEIGIANTAFDWHGTRWTMLMWPLADDAIMRRRLIAHELWHRVQADIGFPSSGAANLHLGTRDGRVWLRLEWRALAAALAQSGDARTAAVRDALAFREKRLSQFTGARMDERSMLMHEGLAEYTGLVLAIKATEGRFEQAVSDLQNASASSTFVRSFAYATGPAYGLLLDAYKPGWRSVASPEAGIVDLLAESVAFSHSEAKRADGAIARYDGRALMEVEDRLEDQRREKLADMRRRFVTGPTLTLDFAQMNVQFDPGVVEAL
ncbi:MAG: hypothetical protein R3282_03780, partial [Rhodothermales bacterium]|nr:hypothetical protein [Rhodothermales bacterium]